MCIQKETASLAIAEVIHTNPKLFLSTYLHTCLPHIHTHTHSGDKTVTISSLLQCIIEQQQQQPLIHPPPYFHSQFF